jgi:hypothetical protein
VTFIFHKRTHSYTEFGKEHGSAAANRAHKEKAKKEKASKNQGEWKGMH